MRKGLRTLIAGLCTLALTVSPAFAQGVEAQRAAQGPSLATQDTSSGEMVATGQENTEIVSTDPKITRTNKFTLDGKFNYQSLGNDTGKATLRYDDIEKDRIEDYVKLFVNRSWSEGDIFYDNREFYRAMEESTAEAFEQELTIDENASTLKLLYTGSGYSVYARGLRLVKTA